jgi:hypothetical protein
MILVPFSPKGILDNQPTGQNQLSALDDFVRSNASTQSPNPLIFSNLSLVGTLPVQPYPQTQLSAKDDFLRSKESTQLPNPQIIVPIGFVGGLDNQPDQTQLIGTYDFLSSHGSSQTPNPQIIVPIGFEGTLQGQPAQLQLAGACDFLSSKDITQLTNPLIDLRVMKGYTRLHPAGQTWLDGHAFRFLSSPGWDVYVRYDSTITLVQSALGQASYDITITPVNTVQFDETILLVNTASFDETIYLQVTRSYDQTIYLWKTGEQPKTKCVLTEVEDITSTIGKIIIEHPAIKKIEFYDSDDVMISSETNMTDLQKGKIVTKSTSILDINKTLKYIKVTTANNKIHTIYV